MSELWQNTRFYHYGRKYVDFMVRLSFSVVDVRGFENVPKDSAVILASNHTNTLMDPLVQLLVNKGPVSFGARADVFRKPAVARILHELKIVPLARQRDGASAVTGNLQVFEEIAECINHNVPFVIFPEGRHRPMHSLLPVKKGVFRIAELTFRKSGKPVYVVPVGVDYEDYFHFCKGVRIQYGEPIEISSMLERYDDEQKFFHDMTEELYDRMSKLILFFPDDETYHRKYRRYLRRHNIRRPVLHKICRCFSACLTFPLFAVAAVMGWMGLVPAAILVRRLKDKAWSNTMCFASMFAAFPLQLILNTVLAFCFLPAGAAVAIMLATVFAVPGFYRLLNFYREVFSAGTSA